ncbi:MAG: hypothetical protein N3B18_13370 [Desulfobacterota bacterium]|nr:hypothetical protein [Thermodesulfobacteriota bacterium]
MQLYSRDKILCLASYLASKKLVNEFDPVIQCAIQNDCLQTLKDTLVSIDAPYLLRRLSKKTYETAQPLNLEAIWRDDETIFWQNKENPIGKLKTYYKKTFPQETQARIAYEIFYDRFFNFIAYRLKIVCLFNNALSAVIFVPQNVSFDLTQIWNGYVIETFSFAGLRKTFIPLVNSIKLSGRGFSTIDVPIVSKNHALVLAAFYRKNLENTQKSDFKREAELKEIEKAKDEGKLTKQQKRKNLENEIAKRKKRYEPAFQSYEETKKTNSAYITEIEKFSKKEFSNLAALQLSQRGNIVAKIANEIKKLARLAQIPAKDFFSVPLLLYENPIPLENRKAGDAKGDACYACGYVFETGEKKLKANRFIFENPSQRLQSGGNQTEPKICQTCAAISFVSPIKTGPDCLIIKLVGNHLRKRLLFEDQLRMLTMGELNLVSGKYALIHISEKIKRNKKQEPLSDWMGLKQYALYKTASLFSAEVFFSYDVVAILNNSEIILPKTQLVLCRGLIETFGLDKKSWWDNDKLYPTVGSAIRHTEKMKIVFAVYEMLKTWRWENILKGRLNVIQTSRLEQLYESFWRCSMEDKPEQAEFFKDIAAVTGLLYPFCSFSQTKIIKEQSGNERIEVRKEIERIDDPFGFIYTVAGNIKHKKADLYRNPDIYFCYDCCRCLLEEIGVNANERESTSPDGKKHLTIYFDDIVKAYTFLSDKKYKTPKEWKEFTYELKLSLYSRFPEFMESNSKKGE